jgi:hypothetical protein
MGWKPSADAKLIKLKASGSSASEIARAFGTTRNAVIARSHRIMGKRFWSEVEREKLKRRAAAERRKARLSTERRAIKQLSGRLKAGMERDQAIVMAREDGATLRAISRIVGITKQRVSKIASTDGGFDS